MKLSPIFYAAIVAAAMFVATAPQVQAAEDVVILDGSTPLHIGDNTGTMDDVVAYKKAHPSTKYVDYTAKLQFSAPAAGPVVIEIEVLSLDDSQYDCAVMLQLNDGSWVDLRKHADKYGEGVMSIVRIAAEAKGGKNALIITSNSCTFAYGHYNDAVLRTIKVKRKT